MTTTPEERALFVGERILSNHELYRRLDTSKRFMLTPGEFTFWLSSPNGLTAVEDAMIGRGYDILTHCNYGMWFCTFVIDRKEGIPTRYEENSPIKPEAILAAAYKALKGEE